MELYIEKEFLDNFSANYDEKPVQKIVKNIITEYGDKKVFINYKIEEFEKIKNENCFFALISNTTPPQPIQSIKEHVFRKSDFKQTFIFMNEEKDWFMDAETKGALCFTFNNYEAKITEIIDKLHFKIDLSEPFKGWDFLSRFKFLTFNHITITDGYILTDKFGAKMNDNIIPILKQFNSKNSANIKIDILTKNLNPKVKTSKNNHEQAISRYKYIVKNLPESASDLTIFMLNIQSNYDFHDRVIQTNYSLMDCGKGFNLMKSKISNSQITSETIFDKYTYNRLKNHTRMLTEYTKKLKGDKFDSLEFYMYPKTN